MARRVAVEGDGKGVGQEGLEKWRVLLITLLLGVALLTGTVLCVALLQRFVLPQARGTTT